MDYGYDFNPDENRRCSKCGKRMMLEQSNVVAASNPPIYSFYWVCLNPEHEEYEEKAGHFRPEPEHIIRRRKWESLQSDPQQDGGE